MVPWLRSSTVPRAKPRLETYVYMYPSAPLGVQTSAPLGVQTSAPLGEHSILLKTVRRAKPRRASNVNMSPSAPLGVQPRLRSGYNPRLRSGCNRGNYPSASLGVQSWQLPLGFTRDAIVIIYRKIMSVMREKPIWLLIFEMNSCFRRVNSCRQGAL